MSFDWLQGPLSMRDISRELFWGQFQSVSVVPHLWPKTVESSSASFHEGLAVLCSPPHGLHLAVQNLHHFQMPPLVSINPAIVAAHFEEVWLSQSQTTTPSVAKQSQSSEVKTCHLVTEPTKHELLLDDLARMHATSSVHLEMISHKGCTECQGHTHCISWWKTSPHLHRRRKAMKPLLVGG